MDGLVYLKEVLRGVPRLLSLLDRNPLSDTYGCFDRQYWHYTVLDFPCARSQEASLTLALLYKINHKLNPYYQNELILDWINAALMFWTEIQEDNGSFNEWYPHENSFVATAFSSYAISEVVLELGNQIKNKGGVIRSLKKSADWLLKKDEKRAVNQETGAALFLYNIFLLTGNEKYRISSGEKIEFVSKNQNEEGWFPEYGGADIGYLSLAIDYLAKYYKKSGNRKILDILQNSVGFISYFIHPDLTFGGVYGSRNTGYLIPDGFEILSREIPIATPISEGIKRAIEHKTTLSPQSLDDRYLTYITYTYLQAYNDSRNTAINRNSEGDACSLPVQCKFSRHLPNSGFWIFGNNQIYLIVNYKKGGTFNISFKENNNSLHDSGLMLRTANDDKVITSWLTDKTTVELNENKIHINGNMYSVPENYLSPIRNIFLRTFQMTFGKSTFVGDIVKNTLRDKLITDAQKTDIAFSRMVEIRADEFEIKDKIDISDNIHKLIIGGGATHIYTPSSRYFQNSDLASTPVMVNEGDMITYKDSNKLCITRIYNMQGKCTKRRIEGV